VLLLVTFRDTEADVPRRSRDARRPAPLRRRRPAALAGLSERRGRRVRAPRAGGEPGGARAARAIGDLTGGNAFLVCELWRALVETGIVEVADGTIRPTRPLASSARPRACARSSASGSRGWRRRRATCSSSRPTGGREFELDVVRARRGREPELLTGLDEAVRCGMIEELPSRTLAYRFTHELVRRALYDRLTGVRRAELHLRIGEALESAEGRSGRVLADLAHHFAAAAPLGHADRGVVYNVLAARAATAALAFDEAVARLRTALELRIESPHRRAEVLLELGTAGHRAGRALEALEAFRMAAAIARELDDADLLARAAIGYEDACWRPGIDFEDAVELLEEATAALSAESSELRVRLLGGLTRALAFQGRHERAAIVRTSAVGMARQLDDRAGLAILLARSYWARGTSSLEEILDMLTEAMALGEALGDTELRAEAMSWRVPTFVALGDLDSARRQLTALHAIAEQTAQPFVIHVAEHYSSALALADGRLDERGAGAALARVEPAPGRQRGRRRLRDPDVHIAASRDGSPSSRRSSASWPATPAVAGRGDPASPPCSSSSHGG
jgi:tetratricopeptide (TPR) repeat protein